jgi:hypothetical protein
VEFVLSYGVICGKKQVCDTSKNYDQEQTYQNNVSIYSTFNQIKDEMANKN